MFDIEELVFKSGCIACCGSTVPVTKVKLALMKLALIWGSGDGWGVLNQVEDMNFYTDLSERISDHPVPSWVHVPN